MPMARAGQVSVIRLSHRICVANSGSTTAVPAPLVELVKPITLAPTTPRNTVSTSPMLDDSR